MADISALDLHYLIEEMQILKGARVDKIIQPSATEVFLQFYAAGKGKKTIKISLPSGFYLSQKMPAAPEKLLGFCAALRKYLSNARLEKIEQEGSERAVKLAFKAKDEEYSLFIELFSKGNMILCRKDMAIIVPATSYETGSKEIRPRAKYDFPKKEANFFKLEMESLKKIAEREKKPISKTLAVELGFGGQYAKEICLLSGIEGNDAEINEEKAKKLLKAIKLLTSKKTEPCLVYENKKIKCAIPFELEIYKSLDKKRKESFNLAAEEAAESGAKKPSTKLQKETEKVEKIISMQEAKIIELQKSADENQRKGEAIYEKYQLAFSILEEIKKARKTHSWKEIKEKLKGHKIIKEVNEKTGEIVLDI